MSAPFARVAVIGIGLLGSSILHAVRAYLPGVALSAYDADPQVRERARALELAP